MTDRFPTADERWPRNGEVADMKKPNLKWYDWNKLITAEDREMVCKDVDQLIKDGKYFTNSPKYQTNINVMGLQSAHWMKIKMSFVTSCFMYAEKELKIKNVQSWSYQTSLNYEEPRDNLWHHHQHNKEVQSLSGVYYVHLPEVLDECGTEFAIDGPEEKARHMEPPRIGQWVIYPSNYWHRPGILKSKENRYIVAADLWY